MADEYHGLGPPGVIRTAAAKAAKSIRFRTAPECVAKLLVALRTSNYRIQLNAVLNRCCAHALVLESILLILVVKKVLQHIPPESGLGNKLSVPT
jgi:hypothetical protein